jgi:predicted adenylyl cyclase CyaB
MGTNVEIKARARDFLRQKQLATALSERQPVVLQIEDLYFNSRDGRLMLRTFADGRGEMLFYRRESVATLRESRYVRSPVSAPSVLALALTEALGTRGFVRNRRTVCQIGESRVHLDEVENLGCFIELETPVGQHACLEHGAAAVQALMQKLEIGANDLLAEAYIDMLFASPVRVSGEMETVASLS